MRPDTQIIGAAYVMAGLKRPTSSLSLCGVKPSANPTWLGGALGNPVESAERRSARRVLPRTQCAGEARDGEQRGYALEIECPSFAFKQARTHRGEFL